MKLYYFLGRLVSPVVGSIFYLYSLLTNTPRARVVVTNEDGEVLLVQTWPDGAWGLPGGGLERGERAEEAAARELREETGINVPAETMRPRTTFRSRGHQELVYSTTIRKDRLPDVPPNRWEVRRAKWFSQDSLPNVSSQVRYVLREVAAQR